jgi:hypothetical protein
VALRPRRTKEKWCEREVMRCVHAEARADASWRKGRK